MKQCIVLIDNVKNIVNFLGNIQYGLWYAEQTERELCLAFPDYDKVRDFIKSEYESILFKNCGDLYNKEYIVDIDLFTSSFLSAVPLEPDLNNKDNIVYIYGNYTNYKQYHDGYIIDKININESIYNEIKDTYKDVYDFSEINVSLYVDKPIDIEGKNQLRKIYKAIIKQFPQGGVKYLVMSDDIEWCKKNLTGDAFIFMDKDIKNYNKDLINIIIQTMCDDNILGNNLISWWGAFLNKHKNKKVYYQYPWEPYNDIIDNTLGWKRVKLQEKYNIALCLLCEVNHIHTFDWISYYKKMGVKHIYMYNYANSDDMPNDILHYYIEKNYVTLFNTTGMELYTPCYSDCYKKYGELYDWMGFLTINDFYISDIKLHDLLYDNKFKDFQCIKLARQEYIAVDEEQNDFDLNNYSIKVKSKYNEKYMFFVRTKLNNVIIGEYGPLFYSNKNYKICYVNGKECDAEKEYIYDGPFSKFIR